MSSHSSPLVCDLVLIGGGHAHVHVLKMLGMMMMRQVPAGIRVTLITNTLLTPYSGMLPGYLAGHYTYEEIHLDLHQLCRFSNIRLIHATAEAITYDHDPLDESISDGTAAISGWITCRDAMTGELRPPVRYDCLSIDIGITPSTLPKNLTSRGNSVIPVKPIANFCIHYQQLQQRVLQQIIMPKQQQQQQQQQPKQQQEAVVEAATAPKPIRLEKPPSLTNDTKDDSHHHHHHHGSNISSKDPFTILVVGGGAGGVEVALSIQYRLHQLLVLNSQQQQPPSVGGSTFHKNKNNDNDDDLSLNIRIVLATRGSTLLEGHNSQVQRTMLKVLQERNVQIRYHAEIVSVQELPATSSGRVKIMAILATLPTSSSSTPGSNPNANSHTANGTNHHNHVIECDECLWCTSAVAPSWLSTHTPFPCTEVGGFIKVTSTLQCVHHPGVFAAGDCCEMTHAPRPKAGVFAVRAGPFLFHNILAYLRYGGSRRQWSYAPQKTFLSLISTGDAYAIASKGKYFCIQGKWVWTWKDYIDRAFMAKYQDKLAELHHGMMARLQQQQQSSFWQSLWRLLSTPRPIAPQHARSKGKHVLQAFTADPMRCGGCGAKVGSSTLSRVLAAIQQRQAIRRGHHDVCSTNDRLDHDDVAVVPLPPNATGGNMIYTIDYFRSMVSDPYLFGKICAIHALSDIHAMGVATTVPSEDEDGDNPNQTAPSITALALCVVPFCADESLTESTLMDLLSGGSDVLQDEQVRLVGGHTCEGMELACGFSIQGFVPQHMALFRKRGGRIGDKLVLTKPIGTGALMAADMRVKIKAPWMEEALNSMLRSNAKASRIAAGSSYGPDSIHACTDVTGFGLIGHLLEMLMANDEDDDADNGMTRHYDSIGATINLQAVPIFEGALAASSQEVFSTLQVSNSHNRRAVANHVEAANIDPIRYPLLFDPQTAGGLLFFVDPNVCHEFVADLQQFYPDASIIGEVVAHKVSTIEVGNNYDSNDATVVDKEDGVSTIGSGGRNSGKRIHIVL